MSRSRKAKIGLWGLVLALVILQGGLSLSSAQTVKQPVSQFPEVNPPLVFDPKRVETLVGEVTKIDLIPNTDSIGLTMTTPRWDKKIKVSMIVGPKWFYEQQKFQIGVGDLIEVKGTRLDLAGTRYIPYEIKKGNLTMKVHDYQGPKIRPLYRQEPTP